MQLPTIEHFAAAVQDAALAIKYGFRRPHEFESKSDGTLLTEVDIQVQHALMRWTKQYPHIGYIGEEGNDFADQPYIVYVDPLDGTSAFHDGQASVTTAASLMKQRKDGNWHPIMAVIDDPIGEWTWIAEAGRSTKVSSNHSNFQWQETHVSPSTELQMITVSTWPNVPFNLDRIEQHVKADRETYKQRQYGGIALVAGLIASGIRQASLFASPSAVETAAMALIVKQAGGVTTDLFGEPLHGYELKSVKGKLDLFLPRGAIMSADQSLTDQLVKIVRLYNP